MVWTLVATVFDAITGNASSTTATPPGNSADLSPSKVGSTEAEHNGELEDVFGAFSALTLSDKGKIAKTGVLERPKNSVAGVSPITFSLPNIPRASQLVDTRELLGEISIIRNDHESISAPPPRKRPVNGVAKGRPPYMNRSVSQAQPNQRQKEDSPVKKTCSGTTLADTRCQRSVSVASPYELSTGARGKGIERYCPTHLKLLLEPSGFNLKSKQGHTKWIKFEDWIPSYLDFITQAILRRAMESELSKKDDFGFIYIFEIRDPDNLNFVEFKVGRTITLAKRLDEWAKQCPSKEQVLKGWWPGNIENDEANLSLLRACIKPGEKGSVCHRLEQLIHIELADLEVNKPYLRSDFLSDTTTAPTKVEESKLDARPHLSTPKNKYAGPRRSSPEVPRSAKVYRQKRPPCIDCATCHEEIFTLERPQSGPLKGREWDGLVKPIIKKWGQFVTENIEGASWFAGMITNTSEFSDMLSAGDAE